MKFDHTVKYNGEYYPAGTEVPMPEENSVAEEVAEEKPKQVKNKSVKE